VFDTVCVCVCVTLDYRVIEKIGAGTFSEVMKVKNMKDGKHYACKTIKQSVGRYDVTGQRPQPAGDGSHD